MKGGRLIHEIQNGSYLSAELLKEVFDVDARIIRIPDTDQIYVSF
jgi:ABC-type cobalamin/Fe3+-siderophores transport system ATPase subunit